MVTCHLSEGSFVQNRVVQIPKFDANPNPMPTRFGQMTLRTSELTHDKSEHVVPIVDMLWVSLYTKAYMPTPVAERCSE